MHQFDVLEQGLSVCAPVGVEVTSRGVLTATKFQSDLEAVSVKKKGNNKGELP